MTLFTSCILYGSHFGVPIANYMYTDVNLIPQPKLNVVKETVYLIWM